MSHHRGKAISGSLDYYYSGGRANVTKSRRGTKQVFNRETGIPENRLIKVEEGWSARLTKKEAKLVEQVQNYLAKSTQHSIIEGLPKDLKINTIHVEDRTEWYARNRAKELKGAKDPYNMTKDAPVLLRKTKGGGTTLVLTYSATQQGTKELNRRYKNNKGVARNLEEAVLREQAKLVYNNIKRTNPSVYDTVHRQLIRYNYSHPTSKSASRSIKTRKSTVESFADAYVLNATKRKNSLGKQQRALVRGTMHWLGDRNHKRTDLGTTGKLYRLEDKSKKKYYNTSDGYKDFITKYTKKR